MDFYHPVNCEKWKRWGRCRMPHMRAQCEKTCGFCGGKNLLRSGLFQFLLIHEEHC